MFSFLLAVAAASPLRLPAGPESTAEVLTPASPERVDILLHHQTGPVERAQVPSDGILSARVVDLGGTWVVSLWPTVTGSTATAEKVGDTWVFRAAQRPDGAAPIVDRCDARSDLPILPLVGPGMSLPFNPSELDPVAPRWGGGEAPTHDWAGVATLRHALADAHEGERGPILYALGAQHRDLGYLREAAYYFGAAAAAGTEPGISQLQRAHALLSLARWEDAREAASDALRAGAPESSALEVEGVALLYAKAGDTLEVGRALAAVADRPEAHQVAGALLMRAGCFADGAAALADGTGGSPRRAALGKLLLADALLLTGDLAGATDVIGDVSTHTLPGEWAGLARSRSRLAGLVRQTPSEWAQLLPSLGRASAHEDAEAAESLYFVGQISERIADPDGALDAYTRLIDLRRELTTAAPGRRLYALLAERVHDLAAGGRDVEAAATWSASWRPDLMVHTTDPAAFQTMAGVYHRLGLPMPELEALGLVMQRQTELGLDDRETILAVAEAWRAAGRRSEALESVDLLETRPQTPELWARAALLRASLLEEQGDTAAARAVLETVLAPPEFAAEAATHLGMLEADGGDCAAALLHLPEPTTPTGDVPIGLLAARRARCEHLLGQDATAAGTLAATNLLSPAPRATVGWMAGLPVAPDAPGPWARLEKAEQDWADLRGRVEKRSTSGATAR